MESQAAHWWHLLLLCGEEASESSEVVVPWRLPVRRVLTVPTARLRVSLVSGLFLPVVLAVVSGLILPVETRVCLERGRACEAGVAHRADVRAEVGVGLQVLQRGGNYIPPFEICLKILLIERIGQRFLSNVKIKII